MGGMSVLERTTLTWATGAGVAGPETTLVSNVDVSRFAELQAIVRLHAFSAGIGGKVELRVRASAPTGEDPAQTFRPSTPELAYVTFVGGSAYLSVPALRLSDVLVGFGTHVDLTVQLTGSGQSCSASISVDFSLHEDQAPVDLTVMALLSSSDYFAGPASTGPSWSATGGAVGIVFRKIVAGSLTREYHVRRWNPSPPRGWRTWVYDGANARLLTGQVDTQPVDLSAINTVTLQQNVFHRAVLTNNAGTLECYLDGVLCQAATVLPSYTSPTTESLIVEGSAAAVDEMEIASISISDTGMNVAKVAWWDAMVKAGGSRRLPGATAHLEAGDWEAKQNPWIDRVLGIPLAVTGVPVPRRITSEKVVWA